MITVAEVRRLAESLEIGPPVVDHDYVLGCFLHYLALQPEVQSGWIFKGGTALRKCYFSEYRFSEDLDFTAITPLRAPMMRHLIDAAKNSMQEALGISVSPPSAEIEILADDYGKESFDAKIYYEGPWQYGGTPRSLRIHVNHEEELCFPPPTLPIIHLYSDKPELPKVSLKVYGLEEICSEKLRAFSGQRKWAIARDVYDLYMLSQRNIDLAAVVQAFPKKCLAKDLDPSRLNLAKVTNKRREYESNWRDNLEYLVPASTKVLFEEAWRVALQLLTQAIGQ